MKRLDLNGQKFGRLTVLECAGPDARGSVWWRCLCSCGKNKSARGADLKRGLVQSCGCWNSERTSRRNATHGNSKTRLYRIWQAMRDRTSNKNASRFGYYGGRGITVCDEWQRFETFRAWALDHGYAVGLSIDRINNDGNYEPKNCRWVTQDIQVANQRPKRTQKLTPDTALAVFSDTRTYRLIAATHGISVGSVYAIKNRKNWKQVTSKGEDL